MFKFARQIAMVMLAILILAAALILCLSAEAQTATGKQWAVVMRFKDEAGSPSTRIYILIDAESEGQAAINASKFLYEKLQPRAYESLVYVEAQQKK